jgi:hypothetical protein
LYGVVMKQRATLHLLLCGLAAACGDRTASQCPASYAALSGGGTQACSPSLGGTDCWYPEGVCQCSDGLGGPAEPMGWYCVRAVPGCPYPTPKSGSSCTTPGQVCASSCEGPTVMCDDGGTWRALAAGCPA